MGTELYNELLKRRGNKRYNFRVWDAFLEDWKKEDGISFL